MIELEPIITKIKGYFDVRVSIEFKSMQPLTTIESIELDQLNARLSCRSNKFSDEIEKRMKDLEKEIKNRKVF